MKFIKIRRGMKELEKYYVNNNSTYNPGYHHEVHTEEHANELNISSKTYLGYYHNCFGAVDKVRKYTEMQTDVLSAAQCVIKVKFYINR